jgi:hypothetical protein
MHIIVAALFILFFSSALGLAAEIGETAHVPEWQWVDVKNLDPVFNRWKDSLSLKSESTCGIAFGGIVKVIGKDGSRLLVEYTLPDKPLDIGRTHCPSGVIFFIDNGAFSVMEKSYSDAIKDGKAEEDAKAQEVEARNAEEDTVRRLLETPSGNQQSGGAGGGRQPPATTTFQITAKVSGQLVPESFAPGRTGEVIIKSGQLIQLYSSAGVDWAMKDQNGNTTKVKGKNNRVRGGEISSTISANTTSWEAEIFANTKASLPYLLTVTATSVADPSQKAVVKLKLTD